MIALWTPRLRSLALAAILLSLFAPWFRFSDGSGVFPGWWMLLAAFVSPLADWSLHRRLLLLCALSLATMTLAVLGLLPSLRRAAHCRLVFLLVALAAPLGYAWRGGAQALWGVHLTAACIGGAIALEAALWAAPRLRRPA